jgi:hemerythrin-like domain-containing protein
METIAQTLSHDHLRCDQLFAKAEESVAKTDWELATTNFTNFRMAMERHFTMEEEVLFPTIEKRAGQRIGPTQVMRMEHQQMRQVFVEMEESITQQDSDEYLGLSETLLMLMQQHNGKEEHMLYPLSDRILQRDAPSVIEEMQQKGAQL